MSDPTQNSDEENWIEKAKEDLKEIDAEIDTAKSEFAAEHKKVETFIDGLGNDDTDEDAADEALP